MLCFVPLPPPLFASLSLPVGAQWQAQSAGGWGVGGMVRQKEDPKAAVVEAAATGNMEGLMRDEGVAATEGQG